MSPVALRSMSCPIYQQLLRDPRAFREQSRLLFAVYSNRGAPSRHCLSFRVSRPVSRCQSQRSGAFGPTAA